MSSQSAPQSGEQLQEYQHIGAYLRDLRLHYRLKVEDVAARLHIRGKYIQAIEDGRIEELPGKVYTVGYIQSYAEFLGLNGQEVLKQYQDVEKLDKRQVFRVVEPNSRQGLPSRRLLVLSLLVMAVAFVLAQFFDTDTTMDEPVEAGIEAVPSRIVEHARQALISSSVNEACLNTDTIRNYPPCYAEQWNIPLVPFLLKPVDSIMEIRP